MDFILENYALDHPDEFEFVRAGQVKPLPTPETQAQWERVMIGKAKTELLAGMMPSEAVLKKAKEMEETGVLLRGGSIGKDVRLDKIVQPSILTDAGIIPVGTPKK